ncbi:EspF repeat-containing protein [Rhodopirellula sp. SWK7]
MRVPRHCRSEASTPAPNWPTPTAPAQSPDSIDVA